MFTSNGLQTDMDAALSKLRRCLEGGDIPEEDMASELRELEQYFTAYRICKSKKKRMR